MSPSLFVAYLVSFVLLLLLLEQLSYLRKKRGAPGPFLIPPLLGNAVSLVKNPTKFWNDQSSNAQPAGFSVNYLLGRFVVYIRETELSLKVFNNVKPDGFFLVGHPFGKKLFGEHNMIYMFGQEHKDLRARIAPNFTPNALSSYTAIQYPIILSHFKKWLEVPQPVSLRFLLRDMNLETSQMVFVGPYLTPKQREVFSKDYNNFNLGTMALPVDLPGFAFRKARLSVLQLVGTLAECARLSKSRMRSPRADPQCLVDFWMQELVKEIDSSPEILPNTSDRDIGGFLFDFLFAAQDASTSSLIWAVSLLESHQKILNRVREEVGRVLSMKSGKPPSLDDLREMKFTHAVAREVIRVRAPATMVPHVAMQEFSLTDEFVVPKGAIVFPSVLDSCFQGFTDPQRFDPDRYDPARREDQVYKKNFLTFGAGPHQCVGQRYALNHLVLFIAMFVSAFDFTRIRSDGCDDIVYNPTISPKDGCTVVLSKRGEWAF